MIGRIIETLIKIFQALFEEDVQRRGGQRQASGGGSGTPTARSPRRPIQSGEDLEAFLAEMFGQNRVKSAQPTRPGRPARPTRQTRPVKPPARPPEKSVPPPLVSAPPEDLPHHMQRFQRNADQMDADVLRHLGVGSEDAHIGASRLAFQLPGRSPLEQMMWAQVILGPPRSRRRQPGPPTA